MMLSNITYSQELTQTIKGKIVDKDSEMSLPGATVILVDSHPIIGTTTDIDGYFRLRNVPVGRISLQFSYIGYKTQFVSDILLSSGKELSLNISLKESFLTLNEVVIIAEEKKEEAINKMATLSARDRKSVV